MVAATADAPCARPTPPPARRAAHGARGGATRLPRLRARLRGDDGSATAEIAVITPVLMLLILLAVQCALAVHARHVAQSAASRALAAARADGATADDGTRKAETVLNATGRDILKDRHVTVTRDGQHVHVTITGTAITVVPGMHIPITVTSDGDVDKFTPDNRPRTGP